MPEYWSLSWFFKTVEPKMLIIISPYPYTSNWTLLPSVLAQFQPWRCIKFQIVCYIENATGVILRMVVPLDLQDYINEMYPEWLACQHSAITQEPLTNTIAVSSIPAHAGFLSSLTYESLPATCKWWLVSALTGSDLPSTIMLAAVI